MIGLFILAGVSLFVFCIGALSFLMMFQDVAPSQNSYWWPFLIPVGLVGFLISSVLALVAWLV